MIQPQSYIEIIPKEIGLELFERMTTEQVEKLIYNNPLLLRRYGDYLEERLEAEVASSKAHQKEWEYKQRPRGSFEDMLEDFDLGDDIDVVLLDPKVTRFLGLPYRDSQGRGYYSRPALSMWVNLFILNNLDSDGTVLLTPRDRKLLGLPDEISPEEFSLRLRRDAVDAEGSNEIISYLEEEENELSDISDYYMKYAR